MPAVAPAVPVSNAWTLAYRRLMAERRRCQNSHQSMAIQFWPQQRGWLPL